mgnify:CR=1 FL=1
MKHRDIQFVKIVQIISKIPIDVPQDEQTVILISNINIASSIY